MKCMKHILTSEVIRVSDERSRVIRAADTLEPKCWQYCGKQEWKRAALLLAKRGAATTTNEEVA